MKNLILLLLLLSFSSLKAQSPFDELFGSSDTGDLTKLIEFRGVQQLDSLFRIYKTPILVIGTYVYKPYDGCIIRRRSGGEIEERLAGGTASDRNKMKGTSLGRKSDGEDAKRKGGASIASGRTGGGNNENRNKEEGGSNQRNAGMGDMADGRTKDGGSASRESEKFRLFRTNDGGNAQRDSTQGGNAKRAVGEGESSKRLASEGGASGRNSKEGGTSDRNSKEGGTSDRNAKEGSSANRTGNGDASLRNQAAGSTIKIQCKKIPNSVSFELLNISERAKIKVYDVMGLRENVGTKVDYF